MASQLDIPVREVRRRLGADNPWWRAGAGIDPEEAAWPRRAYFPHFCRLALEVGVRRAVVLIGPRRVGMTVMLKHLVKRLLDEGVSRAQRSCMPLLTHRSTRGAASRAWCDCSWTPMTTAATVNCGSCSTRCSITRAGRCT